MSDLVFEPDPLDPTVGLVEDLDEQDDVDDNAVSEVDAAIAEEPTFDTDDFDPRSDVHEQVFALDESLTTDGGDASSDHHGLHDLGDVGDALGDIGHLLG